MLVSLCALAWPAFAEPAVSLEERVFMNHCAVCHGRDARGHGPQASKLAVRPADLTALARRNGGVYPRERVLETIDGGGAGHGPREMPVWGLEFSLEATEAKPGKPGEQAAYLRERMEALADYLGRLQPK